MKIIGLIFFLAISNACIAVAKDNFFKNSEITTPHLTATLVSSAKEVKAGERFQAGLFFQLEKNWHLYWQNPGDSGEPPKYRWSPSPLYTQISAIQWPVPERIPLGPLANYGYVDSVALMQEFQVNKQAKPGQILELSLSATWLVCEEICVPEKGDFRLQIPVGKVTLPSSTPLVFEKNLPQKNSAWKAQEVRAEKQKWAVEIQTQNLPQAERWEFFPLQHGLVSAGTEPRWEKTTKGLRFVFPRNGEAKSELNSGLLVGRDKNKKVVVALYPDVQSGVGEPTPLVIKKDNESGENWDLWSVGLALIGAFLGGIFLNVMPCVFPVLAIKAMHLVRSGSSKQEKVESWLYTAGVWVSFLALAFLLIFLRKAGAGIGWGFQLQSPAVLAGLYVLFLVLSLNFFGVFEWGNRLANAAGRTNVGEGYAGAFFTGVLATAVATPCTAPFMGSAIGVALLAPWWAAIGIFSALAFGMAIPVLVLAHFPQVANLLPRAGDWMVRWKQFFGFLLLASCVWLLWVWQQVVPSLSGANILLASICMGVFFWSWEIGKNGRKLLLIRLLQLIAILSAINFFRIELQQKNDLPYGGLSVWEYNQENLEKVKKENRIAYIDFTASWCLSCQVNKKIVFGSSELVKKFRDNDVVILRGDWTNRNPEISSALNDYGRAGVPLNVFIGPSSTDSPGVLPALLSASVVENALNKRIKK